MYLQVPKKHTDDFRSIKKFKVFNTNNLWANLQAMDRLLSSGKMDLDVLINRKVYSMRSVRLQSKFYDYCIVYYLPL